MNGMIGDVILVCAQIGINIKVLVTFVILDADSSTEQADCMVW